MEVFATAAGLPELVFGTTVPSVPSDGPAPDDGASCIAHQHVILVTKLENWDYMIIIIYISVYKCLMFEEYPEYRSFGDAAHLLMLHRA